MSISVSSVGDEAAKLESDLEPEPEPLAAADEAAHRYPFRFTGEAGEYFKIWIVNITLTVLTLGIYSAWAKVRTQRYFYGNTWLDDSPFEYLADPLTILKGRLLAVALFLVYWVATNFFPVFALLLFPIFLLAFPWIISRTLAFRARNSAYRNLRFNFSGSYGDAAKAFMLWPLLVPFTFGLIWPYVHFKQSGMMVDNSQYGEESFQFGAEPKEFYLIYVIAMFVMMGMPFAIAIMGGLTGFSSSEEGEGGIAMVMMALTFLVPVLLYYFVYVFVMTRITNLIYSSSQVGCARLKSELNVLELMWIYFSNAVAIALSVGLLVPWARIRLARYRAAHTYLLADAELDNFQAGEADALSAAGEEVTNIFDVDVSI